MKTYLDKTQEHNDYLTINNKSNKESKESTFSLTDNRPETTIQRKLKKMVDNSPQVQKAAQLKEMVDNSSSEYQSIQKKESNTGLPSNLKSGIENLSGYAMDDVKVHYNSDKPFQLQANAYAQGTNIHLAPGQEQYLPHEAWHVVQQKQGRVKPTIQTKGGENINDNSSLEKEADVMGAKAMNENNKSNDINHDSFQLKKQSPENFHVTSSFNDTIQRNLKTKTSADGDKIDGSISSVRAEVDRVCKAQRRGPMLDDIYKLETSIASRKREQSHFRPGDDSYDRHDARIRQEQEELDYLESQLPAKAPKAPKKKAEDGWTMA